MSVFSMQLCPNGVRTEITFLSINLKNNLLCFLKNKNRTTSSLQTKEHINVFIKNMFHFIEINNHFSLIDQNAKLK